MKPQKRTYNNEAQELGKAIDIAIESFEKYCPENFQPEHQEHMIKTYAQWKEECLNPKPEYRNLKSLKYSHQDVFTYFQESAGPTIEYFWKRLAEEGLNFKRENKLKKVLDRGRIKGRIEYDYVIDMLVPAQQVGMINQEETKQLSEMIGKYEAKR